MTQARDTRADAPQTCQESVRFDTYEIAVADIILGGGYEFGVGRGHGSMPPKASLRLTPEDREEAVGTAS
jgi:hypothetical protein